MPPLGTARNLENPLYNPAGGAYYSKVNYNFAPVKDYDASQSVTGEVGYGLSDNLTLSASLGYGVMDKALNLDGKSSGLSNIGLGVLYKPLDDNGLVWAIKSGFSIDAGDKVVGSYPLGLPIADIGLGDDTFNISTVLGRDWGDFTLAAEVGYMLDLDTDENYADLKMGDTSAYFAVLSAQMGLGRDWSMNLAYKYRGMKDEFLGQKKVRTGNVVLGANWRASDSTLLSAYADYDASAKEDRMYVAAGSGADGGDNRLSFGLRAGVQF